MHPYACTTTTTNPPVDEDGDEVEYEDEDEVHPLGWYTAEELAHSGSHHSDQDAGVASSGRPTSFNRAIAQLILAFVDG